MDEVIIDLTMTQLKKRAEDERCPYSHEPNAQTIKAIKEARARKNVKEAKNLDDLFNKLGI